MISKLQFNLKFNHPSNIFFLELGSNFLSTILTENSIVKLAVRLYTIFWSKLLHRLLQIYSCICVYLVLYLYFRLQIPPLSKLHLTIVSLKMHSEVLCQNPNLLLYLYLLILVFVFSSKISSLSKLHLTIGFLKMYSDICWVRILICCCICIYFFMCLYFHFSSKGSSKK